MKNSKDLAKYEIGWWQAHHRKEKEKLASNLVKKYIMLHGISATNAKNAINYFFEATKEHDIAEQLEDNGKIKESEMHWKKAEKLLEKHFQILLGE